MDTRSLRLKSTPNTNPITDTNTNPNPNPDHVRVPRGAHAPRHALAAGKGADSKGWTVSKGVLSY